jgi:Mn2+/Fe2+ NRAMP family transporter
LGTTPSPHHFFVSGAETLEEVPDDDQIDEEVEDTEEA